MSQSEMRTSDIVVRNAQGSVPKSRLKFKRRDYSAVVDVGRHAL